MRAILMYHSIDPSGSPISLSPAAFARHVKWLASDAVRVVPLADILTDGEGAAHTVAVTFDDGFANLATDAWPRLLEHGLPATVFVVTQKVGMTNDWTAPGIPPVPALPLMDWETLGRLAEQGLGIGAHTRTHADLTGLDTAQVAEELTGANEDLTARLGVEATTFAYPYGRYNRPVADAARARYSLACTTELSWLTPGNTPDRLPRLDMYYFEKPGRLESFGRGGFRGMVRFRAAARAVRSRIGSLRSQ